MSRHNRLNMSSFVEQACRFHGSHYKASIIFDLRVETNCSVTQTFTETEVVRCLPDMPVLKAMVDALKALVVYGEGVMQCTF